MCIRDFFFQAEDGIRFVVRSRGLGDVYKRQVKLWERDCDGWIRHDGQITCHTATAYWTPIDPTNIPGTIKVTQSSPLTLETLREWAIDVRRRFQ